MTAPHDGNPSVQALRLRVGRLGSSGDVVTGATAGYCTKGLIELGDTPTSESGTSITVRNASDDLAVDLESPDRIKSRALTLTMVGVEDELIELLIGALLIQATGVTIGHADPLLGEDPNPNGVSMEIWTRNITGQANDPTLPYFWWLYGKTYGWTRGEDRFLNGHKALVFNGKAIENAGLRAAGPFKDWTGPVNRCRAVVRAASSTLPAAQVGYIAVPV